jgi:hypothetical protein
VVTRAVKAVRNAGRWMRENLAILLAATSILFTVVYVHYVDHEFCQVVTAATQTPVARPADPAANPSREQSWEWYERFVMLGHRLGC